MKKPESKKVKTVTKSPVKELPQILYMCVTDEIRKLAAELEKSFDRIYPVNGRPQRKANIVYLKVADASLDEAHRHLSDLGKLKNLSFPGSFDDYFERQMARFRILSLEQLESRANEKSYHNLLSKFPKPHNQAARAAIRKALGVDPLECPNCLRRTNYPLSEILIFLDHFLPFDLSELIEDIAHTKLDVYPAPFKTLAFLQGFHSSFRLIPLIRVELIRSDRELQDVVNVAHETLLRLSDLLLSHWSATQPHVISIIERNDDLVFVIDGETPKLTKTQKETLVALALLRERFSVETFDKFVGTPKSKPSQTFLNRKKAIKNVLPRLEYDPKHGISSPRGLHFIALLPDERLEAFFSGDLGADV